MRMRKLLLQAERTGKRTQVTLSCWFFPTLTGHLTDWLEAARPSGCVCGHGDVTCGKAKLVCASFHCREVGGETEGGREREREERVRGRREKEREKDKEKEYVFSHSYVVYQ